MSGTVLTVILNYRTPAMTLRAAEAAVQAMKGVEGAIVIVDNDSQDGSFEQLIDGTKDLPNTRVLQAGRNGGFGAGNNVGIRAGLPGGVTPDFVYLLNSDAFPEPGAITYMRDYLLEHPDCGFVGSHVRGEDDVAHVTAFRFPSVWSEFESAAHTGAISRLLARHVVPMGVPDQPTQIDWCAGASVMFPMRVLDKAGLFDEAFFLYFEETDLCIRVQEVGYRGMYLPQARVVHIGSASTGMKTWTRMPEYWFASRSHYFRKRGGRPYLVAVTLSWLVGAALWKLRRLVERKDERIAPHFVRDLVRHTMRHLMPRATATQDTARAQGVPAER